MTTSPARGRLVCLEGIDGAGKTTAVTAAGALLRERGLNARVLDKSTVQFASAYQQRHMGQLRALIWEHPPDDPYLELGDMHWVHLQAAWYLAVSRCVVEPLVAAATIVLADTWTHKFLAKLAMRPDVDMAHVDALFAGVRRPDQVIRLVIAPAVAAARKQVIAASEAGNHEGEVALTAESFVAYQQRLAVQLDTFAGRDGWQAVDVTSLSVEQAAAAVADRVCADLPAPAVPR